MSVAFGPEGPVHGRSVMLAPLAARSANGNGGPRSAGMEATARLVLQVTTASGTTPTLDVVIETSADKSTWASIGSFGQKTAVSTERKVFTGLDQYVRARWTLGGTTPNFTFKVSGVLV